MPETSTAPFSGRTALLFGGAKGIGKAIALEWARRGARVAVADLDEEAAKATAAEIVAAGGSAVAVKADVLSDASVATAVAEAETVLGAIDILLNNVGAMLNGHPEDIPMTEWQRMMDLNYFGTLRGIQAVLPGMLARGRGHVVNTASFAGLYPYAASRIPYAAAKTAVISLTQNLALYLEPQGLRVTCLVPGPVLTGVMDAMTTWTEDCPMRGPGAELELMLPEDVALVLSDAMVEGRVLVPSDGTAWDILKRWAASPDAFLRDKIADFAKGERGVPQIGEAVKARLAKP